jgi:hypothetical protein
VCPVASTRQLFWQGAMRVPPPTPTGRRMPAIGRLLYATSLRAIRQSFLICMPHPYVAWVSGWVAAAPRPPAPGGGRLERAVPGGSGPHPALSPGRLPHASTPAHASATRDPHGSPNAALCCTHMVDPTVCQPALSPWPAQDALSRTCSPKRLCVAAPQTAPQ